MDIRSFFQAKRGESTTKATTIVQKSKKETTIKKNASSAPSRRVTKRPIVVVDDSDDDDEDEDMEIVKQPTTKKRIREEEEKDEQEEKTIAKSPKKQVKEEKEKEEEKDRTPIQIKSTGRPPHPYPGCLNGKTFVLTGVFDHLSREDMIHLIKQCGGSISISISRHTSYLILGQILENGENIRTSRKYKEAIEKHIPILKQYEFYNLLTELAANQQRQEMKKIKSSTISSPSMDTNLWTDKYKPSCLADMIGNVELGKRLMQWLQDWDAIHVKHTKKIPFTTKLNENRGAKTVLLSGPPGIGKTTLATLVAHLCGFECSEFNASDTRSKKMLQNGLKDVLGTQAIQFNTHSMKNSSIQLAKRVIIMDEVDGMSGGDRGGTAELIQLIKTSKTPVICICNDRQSTKVKSLANYSYDLRMRRPTKQQISKRLMEIGLKEGLSIEKNALEEAADRCGNDIRQLLVQMQRWRLTTNSITYTDLIQPMNQHYKDESLRLNPFSATQQIFQRDLTFEGRNEAYFVDYDLMPLMIQENYISSILHQHSLSIDEKLNAAAQAAEYIAESDVVSRYVRMEQRWDLLTTQAALNVAACIHAIGFIGHPEFSRWMGKNSTTNKSKRLLSELSVRMRSHASGSRQVIRMDYIPYMKEILLVKLLSKENQIEQVIELLDACDITREDLTESMESFKFSSIKRHSYTELDTKAKTAFTRFYNKSIHKAQGIVERELSTTSTSMKKGHGRTMIIDEEDGLPLASDAESEQEEEEEEMDVSQFQKKKKGKSSSIPSRKAKKAKI